MWKNEFRFLVGVGVLRNLNQVHLSHSEQHTIRHVIQYTESAFDLLAHMPTTENKQTRTHARTHTADRDD